jgi:PleD family two-component response regulator
MQQAGVTVTASLGVASLAPDDDARTLLRRADLAMYTAKSDGRDRVVGIPDFAYLDETTAADLSTGPPWQE